MFDRWLLCKGGFLEPKKQRMYLTASILKMDAGDIKGYQV